MTPKVKKPIAHVYAKKGLLQVVDLLRPSVAPMSFFDTEARDIWFAKLRGPSMPINLKYNQFQTGA